MRDVGRLYVSSKEGVRVLMICQSTIRIKESNLGWYLQNSNKNLFQEVKHFEIMKFKESLSKKDSKKSLNWKRVEN